MSSVIQTVTSKLYSEDRQILHLFVTSFGLKSKLKSLPADDKDEENNSSSKKDRIVDQLYQLAKSSTPYIRYLALACVSYLRPVVEDEGNQRTAQQCLFIALPLIRYQASSGNPFAMVFMGFHYAYTECVDDDDRDKVFTLLFDLIEKDDAIAKDELTRIAKKAIVNEAAKQVLQVVEQNAPMGTMTVLNMASMAYNHFGSKDKEKEKEKERDMIQEASAPLAIAEPTPVPFNASDSSTSQPPTTNPPPKPPRAANTTTSSSDTTQVSLKESEVGVLATSSNAEVVARNDTTTKQKVETEPTADHSPKLSNQPQPRTSNQVPPEGASSSSRAAHPPPQTQQEQPVSNGGSHNQCCIVT